MEREQANDVWIWRVRSHNKYYAITSCSCVYVYSYRKWLLLFSAQNSVEFAIVWRWFRIRNKFGVSVGKYINWSEFIVQQLTHTTHTHTHIGIMGKMDSNHASKRIWAQSFMDFFKIKQKKSSRNMSDYVAMSLQKLIAIDEKLQLMT